jgi:hypothetical protein
MVYVTGWPGTALVWPSVLVIERSAVGVIASVSVAELFPGVGSVTPAGAVTVAVFSSVPVAVGDSVAVTVKVATPLAARSTVAAMSPAPDTGQELPAEARHVQAAPVSPAGKSSVTATPMAALGPALAVTMV